MHDTLFVGMRQCRATLYKDIHSSANGQGCASFQGFLASRALEAEAVGARLSDWAAGPLAH